MAILKLVEGRDSRVYLSLNKHFEAKPGAKRALLDGYYLMRSNDLTNISSLKIERIAK